jgi:enterochelin esterase family protein
VFAVATAVLAQQVSRPAITSPEVLADRRLVFRLWAPNASEVLLSGDWMGPAPPSALIKDESGVRSTTDWPLEPNIDTQPSRHACISARVCRVAAAFI